jgi:protein O-GlcNAc transferase
MSYSHPAVIQALTHHHAGRNPQAKQLLLRALQREPRHAELLRAAVELFISMQEPASARLYAERLAALAPDAPDTWLLRAQADVAALDPAAAIPHARRAVELDPANPDRYRTLAWVLHRARRFREAAAQAAAGLAIDPHDADLWQKQAVALQSLGRADEAAQIYREATSRCPDSAVLAEGLAMLSNYLPSISAEDSLALHRRFGSLFAAQHPLDQLAPARRSIAPTQPVRVGLLSPDLRIHSVGLFAQSLILNHDPARIELFVYSTAGRDDEPFTLKLKSAVGPKRWRYFSWPDPGTIASSIRADQLDLLVELSGLTRDHNLAVVAAKPAPVVASYLGYPHTTGLPTVDFRIVDLFTDPPGPADAAATERPHRLNPCFIAYTPPAEPPKITWTPCKEPGDRPLVFGSFNNLMKLNDPLLRLWARLLAVVPESILVLKAPGLNNDEVREDLLQRAHAAGLPADRLRVLAPIDDPVGHLAAYNQIDVALDTFPYHGTTTTCEALLMGVPVITIEGDRHASRVGVSLLNNAGLQELITQSPEQLIEVAADLIRETDRLSRFRASLRERFLASPVCDARDYASRFADACRAMATGATA